MAYGPPNFGETPKIDAKEPFLSLDLDRPVCVQRGDADDEPAEDSIRHMQINSMKVPLPPNLQGKHVTMIGTIYHSTTGHHHTKILIVPTRIE